MNFCTMSKDNETGVVLLDKSFVVNYLPECDEKQLKVYILGLTLCTLPQENDISFICDALSMAEDEVEDIF